MKIRTHLLIIVVVSLLFGCGGSNNANGTENNEESINNEESNTVDTSEPGETVTNPTVSANCSPLPETLGETISVSPADTSQLASIISSAAEGTTILLEDGVYNLDGDSLVFRTPNVTLRSKNGNPEAVVLNGEYSSNEIISIRVSDITIAELTVQKAYTHPVHVLSSDDGDTLNTLLYRLHVIDPREQAVKINPHKEGFKVDNGEVSCSSVVLTDAGRPLVNPTSTGCYTGGIDAHQARDWVVRDNYFEGFWCDSGLSQHAIHFWTGSRGSLIERNVLVDNARGIGFGLLNSRSDARKYSDGVCPESAGLYIGHYEGIVRNNFISAATPAFFNSEFGFDCGVCLASACRANVVHNTIMSNDSSFASIDVRFAGTNNTNILNNLMSHSIRIRNGAVDNDIRSNLEDVSTDIVLDIENADLHLSVLNASAAIDSGVTLESDIVEIDIDKQVRDSNPDIGADEI